MNIRQQTKELVLESDLYLSGYLADYLDTRNRPVPTWVWLSALVHGSSQQLHSLTIQDDLGVRLPTRRMLWWQAVGFLAGEILAHDDDVGLDELRRSVLVPLELTWLTTDHGYSHPRELVRTVLAALDQFQSSRRRSIDPRPTGG
jgi:hypothetical protein